MARVIQLRRLTTFRIGGRPAAYFQPADDAQLRAALEQCRRLGAPWRVMGHGSNLLVDDGDLPCAVIRIHSPGFDWIERAGPLTVHVGAGAAMAALLRYCRDNGLSGLEFLSGLPGTAGGALSGNAGAWGGEVSGPLRRLRVMSPRGIAADLDRDDAGFAYRACRLAGAVITEAEFELRPASPELIAGRMADYARRRAEQHPVAEPSAGCIFKNPPGQSAGKLLDLCRMKGQCVGGARVSERHANFIVNIGAASARDVLTLIRRMREAVRRTFGVELQLEVKHWAARPRAA